jgi:hypothetical protein
MDLVWDGRHWMKEGEGLQSSILAFPSITLAILRAFQSIALGTLQSFKLSLFLSFFNSFFSHWCHPGRQSDV